MKTTSNPSPVPNSGSPTSSTSSSPESSNSPLESGSSSPSLKSPSSSTENLFEAGNAQTSAEQRNTQQETRPGSGSLFTDLAIKAKKAATTRANNIVEAFGAVSNTASTGFQRARQRTDSLIDGISTKIGLFKGQTEINNGVNTNLPLTKARKNTLEKTADYILNELNNISKDDFNLLMEYLKNRIHNTLDNSNNQLQFEITNQEIYRICSKIIPIKNESPNLFLKILVKLFLRSNDFNLNLSSDNILQGSAQNFLKKEAFIEWIYLNFEISINSSEKDSEKFLENQSNETTKNILLNKVSDKILKENFLDTIISEVYFKKMTKEMKINLLNSYNNLSKEISTQIDKKFFLEFIKENTNELFSNNQDILIHFIENYVNKNRDGNYIFFECIKSYIYSISNSLEFKNREEYQILLEKFGKYISKLNTPENEHYLKSFTHDAVQNFKLACLNNIFKNEIFEMIDFIEKEIFPNFNFNPSSKHNSNQLDFAPLCLYWIQNYINHLDKSDEKSEFLDKFIQLVISKSREHKSLEILNIVGDLEYLILCNNKYHSKLKKTLINQNYNNIINLFNAPNNPEIKFHVDRIIRCFLSIENSIDIGQNEKISLLNNICKLFSYSCGESEKHFLFLMNSSIENSQNSNKNNGKNQNSKLTMIEIKDIFSSLLITNENEKEGYSYTNFISRIELSVLSGVKLENQLHIFGDLDGDFIRVFLLGLAFGTITPKLIPENPYYRIGAIADLKKLIFSIKEFLKSDNKDRAQYFELYKKLTLLILNKFDVDVYKIRTLFYYIGDTLGDRRFHDVAGIFLFSNIIRLNSQLGNGSGVNGNHEWKVLHDYSGYISDASGMKFDDNLYERYLSTFKENYEPSENEKISSFGTMISFLNSMLNSSNNLEFQNLVKSYITLLRDRFNALDSSYSEFISQLNTVFQDRKHSFNLELGGLESQILILKSFKFIDYNLDAKQIYCHGVLNIDFIENILRAFNLYGENKDNILVEKYFKNSQKDDKNNIIIKNSMTFSELFSIMIAIEEEKNKYLDMISRVGKLTDDQIQSGEFNKFIDAKKIMIMNHFADFYTSHRPSHQTLIQVIDESTGIQFTHIHGHDMSHVTTKDVVALNSRLPNGKIANDKYDICAYDPIFAPFVLSEMSTKQEHENKISSFLREKLFIEDDLIQRILVKNNNDADISMSDEEKKIAYFMILAFEKILFTQQDIDNLGSPDKSSQIAIRNNSYISKLRTEYYRPKKEEVLFVEDTELVEKIQTFLANYEEGIMKLLNFGSVRLDTQFKSIGFKDGKYLMVHPLIEFLSTCYFEYNIQYGARETLDMTMQTKNNQFLPMVKDFEKLKLNESKVHHALDTIYKMTGEKTHYLYGNSQADGRTLTRNGWNEAL